MLPLQVQEIAAHTVMSMQMVHISKFSMETRKWNRWRHDFEVAMKGADIPQSRWVTVLLSHLDDLSRDTYKEITTPGCGNQYIQWSELVDLFEADSKKRSI